MKPAAQATRKELIFERDGWRCVNCGRTEELTLDHRIPKSKGGADRLDNLQTMCEPCNSAKGSTMPESLPDFPPLPEFVRPMPRTRKRPGDRPKKPGSKTSVRASDLHPRVRALLT